jgi:hypothetical protein
MPLREQEFHTFIVLSFDPDTIFSFEAIITNFIIKLECPVK